MLEYLCETFLPGRCQMPVATSTVLRNIATGLFALTLFCALPVTGNALLFDDELPPATKARNLNLVAAGTVVAWGTLNWDYFQRTPHARSEEWFSHGTKEGGADKVGHVYTTYVLSDYYASLYRQWNYPAEKAARYGALSALGTTGIMEFGDAFSDYGFSVEDMIMNGLGAAASYWRGTHPEWERKIDFRVEYSPDPDDFEADVFTDYERLKYLVAVKAAGFDPLKDSPLRYFELHLGYFSRNYDDYRPTLPDRRERTLYVAVGLNVGKLLEGLWETEIFDYLQIPYTYLPLEHTLED